MSSSTDILRVFLTSIQYKITSELQDELSSFFPTNFLDKNQTINFIYNLFTPINYSVSELTIIENNLYVLQQFRIYTDKMYSICSSTNSSIKKSYYDNINNYITLLEDVIENIIINSIWISDNVNLKLNTYQQELQPIAKTLVENFFYCVSTTIDPIGTGTASKLNRGTNLIIMRSGCDNKLKETWKVKKIESRFIDKPEHFDYMKSRFTNFNKLHIQRFDIISLIFPYTSQKLKKLTKVPSHFVHINVESCDTSESFNLNQVENTLKIYTIYLQHSLINSTKLKITHYIVRDGKRCFVCME